MLSTTYIESYLKKHGYQKSETKDPAINVFWKLYKSTIVVINGCAGKIIDARNVELVMNAMRIQPGIPKDRPMFPVLITEDNMYHSQKRIPGVLVVDRFSYKIFQKELDNEKFDFEIALMNQCITSSYMREERHLLKDGYERGSHSLNFGATYILILLCIGTFIYARMEGIDLSISNNTVVANHDYYRLVTYMFMHGNVIHLIVNMISLFFIGRVMERKLGSFNMLFIYFVAGLYGALASVCGYTLNTISTGASGSIMGLIGASLIVSRKNIGYVICIVTSFIFATLGQIMNPFTGIDYLCHIGGFLSGVVFQTILVLIYKYRDNVEYIEMTKQLMKRGDLDAL